MASFPGFSQFWFLYRAFSCDVIVKASIKGFVYYVIMYLSPHVSFQARTPQQWEASGGLGMKLYLKTVGTLTHNFYLHFAI